MGQETFCTTRAIALVLPILSAVLPNFFLENLAKLLGNVVSNLEFKFLVFHLLTQGIDHLRKGWLFPVTIDGLLVLTGPECFKTSLWCGLSSTLQILHHTVSFPFLAVQLALEFKSDFPLHFDLLLAKSHYLVFCWIFPRLFLYCSLSRLQLILVYLSSFHCCYVHRR